MSVRHTRQVNNTRQSQEYQIQHPQAKKGQQQEANAKKGKQDMSKEDAERLLRNLGPERKPSKRGKKAKGRRAPGGKDW